MSIISNILLLFQRTMPSRKRTRSVGVHTVRVAREQKTRDQTRSRGPAARYAYGVESAAGEAATAFRSVEAYSALRGIHRQHATRGEERRGEGENSSV